MTRKKKKVIEHQTQLAIGADKGRGKLTKAEGSTFSFFTESNPTLNPELGSELEQGRSLVWNRNFSDEFKQVKMTIELLV